MKKIKNKINYYFWATYRRKLLDMLQEKNRHLYHGVVLDIGGRDRGRFVKPKDKVEKWIFADIESKFQPDIVLDVTDMKQLENGSVDVVNAIELFEHVENIEKGLAECYRVLKSGGQLIISVPFLYPIHADPHDWQRWTAQKWQLILKKTDFFNIHIEVMGGFFTIFGESLKILIKSFNKWPRYCFYLFFPLIDLVVLLDKLSFIKKNKMLNKYHGGYFIVAEKKL